jgi:Tol biopolymer transport system component
MIKVFSDKTNFLRVVCVLILAFAVIDSSGGRGFAVSNVPSAFAADNSKSAAKNSASRNSYPLIAEPRGLVVGTPKIVFGSVRNGGNHDIFSMDLDGRNQIRLTTNAAYDDQPKWSPDSSKIVFMSNRDVNFEIYTMNADGTAQTRITNNFAADGFPAWSPDGTKIAFVRGDLRNPSTFEIYVMNADGGNQIRLTNDSAIDGVPSWSPDGTKIVFMSGGSSVFDPNSFEIYTINADGNNRTRLTNNTIVDGSPSYSPDGTKILFASGNAMNPSGIEIYVMNSDGSNRVQLTVNDVTDGFPAWSFDGSNIVFASGSIADETTVELFMMNADGTNRVKLTTNSELDWFPDWQRIATPPSQIQLISSIFFAGEGSGGALITVIRTGNTTGPVAVDYATSDTAGANNCSVVGSAASSRCDYITRVGTLNFAPGEPSKTLSVFLVDDSYDENDETFTIELSNARGSGAMLGAPAAATIHLTDNDSVNGPNPIDGTNFFVRQHYLDFLNREPDAAGLAFWTGQITECQPPNCNPEVRRINVSAAFYLSIEFQETGYLVYRTYKTAFGDPNGQAVINSVPTVIKVPRVRFNEFLPDTQLLGADVKVGIGNWQQQLENNKQAYMLAFVQRTDFQSAFPSSLTADAFVTQLDTNAGGVLSASEKASLIAVLGATPNEIAKRAQVLRAVAEDEDLKILEKNRAFVLMQYFGYLRRNPNDPQDTDHTGWKFWLDKLNAFNGNFIEAEMVRSFLVSLEYRQRFGP